MLYFLDTNILLENFKFIEELQDKCYLSSITLNELENIKSSGTRDEEIKYKARKALHLIEDNEEKFVIIPYKESYSQIIAEMDLPSTADSKIIACAYIFIHNAGMEYPADKKVFLTNDLACRSIAKAIGIPTEKISSDKEDNYKGYKDVVLDEVELVKFYSQEIKEPINLFDLCINEYLLIKDENDKIIDCYRYTSNGYEVINFPKFESKLFGKVTPKDGDIYQKMAMNSLQNNQITMIRGAAGTGKSYLAVGYLFHLLEHGKIDKIIIFCNTVATKGSAKLGYYPGSRTEKLLDSQIGNFLESKIGDRTYVEKLIYDGDLVLLPLSDIRGFDTTGMNAGIYITEAQNMDIELMRLALQRIGEDSVCIIDGDSDAQVDLSMYAGDANGMRRMSKVFRGADFYGEVTLKNIKRSKIAALAQKL